MTKDDDIEAVLKHHFHLTIALILALLTACSGPVVSDPEPTARPAADSSGQMFMLAPPDFSAEAESLQSWLITAWAEGIDPAEAQAALQAAGWQNDPAQFVSADLTGDGRAEWLVSLCIPEHEEETGCREMHIDQVKGDLWVIGAGGLLYAYSDLHDISWQMAPDVLELADLTGDGRPDALIASTSCGAHTCFQHYLVLSAHHGRIANIMNPARDDDPEGWGEGTSLSTSTWELSDDERPALSLHGGLVGSVGAGIHRGYTELWRWDGATVGYHEFRWDPSDYRFHRLYDANQAWTEGDRALAAVLYEEVISNPGLEDTEWWWGTSEEVRDAAFGFAAFRLALLSLRQGEMADATAWQSWLQDTLPGSPFSGAADLLISSYAGTGTPEGACAAVTDFLRTFENPLGPLHDMGYANPALHAEDVCPPD